MTRPLNYLRSVSTNLLHKITLNYLELIGYNTQGTNSQKKMFFLQTTACPRKSGSWKIPTNMVLCNKTLSTILDDLIATLLSYH